MQAGVISCFITCGVLLGVAAAAAAQEAVGSVYITAGVSFPHQAVLPTGSAPPFPAPGGNTVGWLVGGGVFVSPRVSIEGEMSSTGVMRSTQGGRYGITAEKARRDRFLSFGVKGHLPLRTGVRLEPVAGMVAVLPRNQWSRSTITQTRFSGGAVIWETVPGQPVNVHLNWTAGLMFGADLRIGGSRFAFQPGLRFAFTGAADPYGLYPRWTHRPSFSLAVSF